MSIKILLDTDIGSDIDDAVCLAYLLANRECDLLGITTVSGEVVKRAQIASAICKVAQKRVPIYPGRDIPLLKPQWQPLAQQAEALDKWDHDETFPSGRAVSFMQEMIHSYPGEIILLTIGPLTNIAGLFIVDPEIGKLLKGLVMMCGVFTNRRAGVGPLEWNAILDPHATAIVYRQDLAFHRSIGLDVTMQVQMPADEVRRRFQRPLLLPVLDFAEVWFREQNQITFHDPLAAVAIFDEDVCQFKRGMVEVELTSSKVNGMTYWNPDQERGHHEIALDVEPDRFFNQLFRVF